MCGRYALLDLAEFISAGKLAGILGLSVLEARDWLNEHGLAQPAAFSAKDIAHA